MDNLIGAAAKHGVGNVVILSIVGADLPATPVQPMASAAVAAQVADVCAGRRRVAEIRHRPIVARKAYRAALDRRRLCHSGPMVYAFADYQPEPPRDPAPPVPVRAATPADIPGCLNLAVTVLKLDRGPWQDSLTRSVTDPDRTLHVAHDGDRIVGYARASFWTRPADAPPNAAPTGWYLIGLVVDPGYRRRGVGKSLTSIRLQAIASRASEVYYFANARNQASLDLHTRLGFTELTRDFWFPGLTFEGGEGVLARRTLSTTPGTNRRSTPVT